MSYFWTLAFAQGPWGELVPSFTERAKVFRTAGAKLWSEARAVVYCKLEGSQESWQSDSVLLLSEVGAEL